MSYDKNKRREEYAAKLKDPRWQRIRLQVFDRDQWACIRCSDKKNTLHVHHRYYTKGLEPWEYPLDSLETLCEICHEDESENRWEEEQSLLRALKLKGVTYSGVNELACDIAAAECLFTKFDDLLGLLCWMISSPQNQVELIKLYESLRKERGRIAPFELNAAGRELLGEDYGK